MYKIDLTEEEISLILQALDFYEEHNLHLRDFDTINSIRQKTDKIL